MPKSKGKIHAIVKYFYPVAAGIETNMLETYSVLAKKGWDVSIHTSKDTYDKKDSLAARARIRGLKVKRYPFSAFGFFPKISWSKSSLVCLHNFDVFPHFIILLYCLILKTVGLKKFGVVLTPHGGFSLDQVWSIYPFWKRIIKRSYQNTLAVWLVNKSVDGIRAVSEWERKDLEDKGVDPELIRVIPNGVEDEAFMDLDKLASSEIKEKVRSWGKYIIKVGRIYPIKNHETVIKALSLVPKEIKFVIVGPVEVNMHGNYLDMLKKLIKGKGLEDRVIFTGVIRGVDKYYAIKNSQTMVHMAKWESFCNVVHEALSQGLVPIVAKNTALVYLIKDGVNGYLVGTNDHKSLAKRITYVLRNKKTKKLKAIAKRNRKKSLDETWRNVAKNMDKFYRTLIT